MRYAFLILTLLIGCQSRPEPPDDTEWMDDGTLAVCGLYHIEGPDTSFVATAWPTEEQARYLEEQGMTRRVGTFTDEGVTQGLQRTAPAGSHLQQAEYTCHRFAKAPIK